MPTSSSLTCIHPWLRPSKLVFALAVLIPLTSADQRADSTKPNILLIVADDLGYNDVDFQTPNNSVVKTPNLRHLAYQGVRFSNHHVQPFCSPTRAALMTGRYVLRYGLQNSVIWPEDAYAIPQNETFVSQNLQDAGYYTAALGKWHLGLYKHWALPQQRGFNEQYGYYLGAEDYYTHSRNGGLDWHRNETLVTSENGTYSAELLGTAAVDFISRRAKTEQPWFLYLPFQSVHAPLEAPQKYLDMYPNLNGSVRTRAAMVTAMDDQVGRVTAALQGSKQLDNTIIIFTADNGAPYTDAVFDEPKPAVIPSPSIVGDGPDKPPVGPYGPGGGSNYPLIGWKHYLFEGGVRSASFVYSSKLDNKGSVHGGLFHAVDWLPTIAFLAGADTKRNLPLDGFNIWPAIQQGGTSSPRTEIPVNIAACGPGAPKTIVDGPQAAIIVGDMKLLVECFWRNNTDISGNKAQLYNITADPSESTDLARKQRQLVQQLADRLRHWEQQSVDPYPVDAKCGEGKPFGQPPHWDPWC